MASGNGTSATFKQRIEARFASMEESLNGMANAAREMNAMVGDLHEQVAKIEDKVGDLHTVTGQLATAADATKRDLTDLRGLLDEWQTFLNERHQDHEARIAALEAKAK